MLYSQRRHAPDLCGAEIGLYRAIGDRVVFRRVDIRGLIHDERLLMAPLRVERLRLTVVLMGELCAYVGGTERTLRPGEYIATRIGAMRTRGETSVTFELDWDPGSIGGALASLRTEGALTARSRTSLERLGEALSTRPLLAEAARDALAALAEQGLPFDPAALAPELGPADPADQRLMDALDAALCRLERSPDTEDLVRELGYTRRTLARRLRGLAQRHRMYERADDWRTERDFYRGLVATMFLSHPDATTASIARMLGYRSPAALCHAFKRAGLPSPGSVRRHLLAGKAGAADPAQVS